MKRNDLLKTICLMVIIVGLTVGSSILLNLHTAPIIEANSSGAALEQLKVVMPDATGFEELYNEVDPSTSKLTVQPTAFKYEGEKVEGTSGKVLSVYKEKAGKGYVFRISVITQFSKSPIEYTVGVTSEGVICGINQDVYTDSKTVSAEFTNSFVGKDSALTGVELVGGVTYSSKGIKVAIEQTLLLLVENGLMAAGEKSDAQILEELLSTVYSSFKGEELAATGNITKALRAKNGSGYVYLMTKGEATFLVIVNNMNAAKVYGLNGEKTELADVTDDNADLVTEAKEFSTTNSNSLLDKAIAKFKTLSGSEEIVAVSTAVNSFNTVTNAVQITKDGETYYGFYTRADGWQSHTMDIYVIIDSEGKIYKVDAETLVFEMDEFIEYGGFAGIPSGYLGNMEGKTSTDDIDSFTTISGATMSSKAISLSIKDVFAAYNALGNGGNN